MKILKLMTVAMATLFFITTACKKDDDAANRSKSGDSFKVKMTDSPGNYAALNMEISKVEAYLENDGWVTLNNEAQMVNVVSLTNGAETDIAFTSSAEIGAYSKLRVSFGENSTIEVEEESGNSVATQTFTLKWNGPKEIEIEIDESVTANSSAEVLLDFDVANSIEERANEYIIDPAISVIQDASTGIRGELDGNVSAAILITNGEDTVSTYTDASGRFLARGMKKGMHSLMIMPSIKDQQAGLPQEYRMDGVLVTSGEINSVGVIQL